MALLRFAIRLILILLLLLLLLKASNCRKIEKSMNTDSEHQEKYTKVSK